MTEKVQSKNDIPIRLTDERWSSYDEEADVLYVNFKKPSHATDSDLTDDDVIIRYEGDVVVGLTILHASKRVRKQ